MSIMEYFTPTHVFFGKDAEKKAGEVLNQNNYKKVLVHYGTSSIKKNGLLCRVLADLKENNISYVELGGVVPNPRVSLVRKGIEIAIKENVDFILAVGGGSVLDSAKAIGYGVYNGGDVWDFYCGKRKPTGSLPIGSILTLSATGSEMSDSSVITNDETNPIYKRGCNSNFGRIKYAFLNPELTYSVSKYQTASGSVDIMMHTFERYFHDGYALDLTDELSFVLLKQVMKNLKIALENPNDYDARANLMWAGSISHNGLMQAGHDNRGDWSCHQIEHELSAEYDVAHGAGLSAVWGSWARYVLPINPQKFEKLGIAIFNEKDPIKAIEKFEDFFRSVGMPTNLKELGLNFDDVACKKAALGVTFQNARKIGNFKILDTNDIYEIYKRASK